MPGYIFSESTEFKIIILFIIDNYGEAVDNGVITDIFMTHEFVDYFTMQTCLDELVNASLLSTYPDEGRKKYIITDIGHEAVDGFARKIPKTVRESILHSIRKYRKEREDYQAVSAHYRKLSDIEHMAELRISEGGAPLISVSVNASSKEMADKICRSFKENPQKMYEALFKVLSSDF